MTSIVEMSENQENTDISRTNKRARSDITVVASETKCEPVHVNSVAVMQAEIPAASESSFNELLARREHDIGRKFRDRGEYEYFMMLPINEQQREVLLGMKI